MIQVKAETIREAIDQLEAAQKDKYVQSTENIINDLKQALSINGVGCSLPSKKEMNIELETEFKKWLDDDLKNGKWWYDLGFKHCFGWYAEKMKK